MAPDVTNRIVRPNVATHQLFHRSDVLFVIDQALNIDHVAQANA